MLKGFKKVLFMLFLLLTCWGVCLGADRTSDKPNQLNGHEYVDLGLSVKWATCNVGASTPTEYGDYFAWGETEPKDDYSWETYKWCKIGTDYVSMSKYTDPYKEWGWGWLVANAELLSIDDAATVNWGETWRMPTWEELRELLDGCDWVWQTDYMGTGVAGRMGISKINGNSIFFPAAGYREDSDFAYVGEYGGYWSSTHYSVLANTAYYLLFNDDYIYWRNYNRYVGRSIRAVVAK